MEPKNAVVARIFAVALCSLSLTLRTAEGSTSVLSVCDVLSRLASLQNKEVTLLAVVTNHGNTIEAICARCSLPLASPGHIWPNSIYLHPSNDSVIGDLERIFRHRPSGVVALSGVLRVHLKSRKWLFSKPQINGGFGHLGVHPARLDVLSVIECRVPASFVCQSDLKLQTTACQGVQAGHLWRLADEGKTCRP
jgi:hypothetical protein